MDPFAALGRTVAKRWRPRAETRKKPGNIVPMTGSELFRGEEAVVMATRRDLLLLLRLPVSESSAHWACRVIRHSDKSLARCC